MLGKPNETDNVLLEQYFNPKIFTWQLLISCFLLVTVGMFMFYRFILDRVLVWDKISGERDADKIKRKKRRMVLINNLIAHNWLYLIFWYWFTDIGTIFPTSFDMLCYYTMFLWMSLVYASHKIVEQFVAD